MNRYSTVREHGVQPELPPNTQAVKVDYSLAGDWVAQTTLAPPLNSPPVLLLYVLVIAVQFTVAREADLPQHRLKSKSDMTLFCNLSSQYVTFM